MATTEIAHPRYVARLRNSRISPRKMRLAADMIRGKGVQQASELLRFSVNKSSRVLGKMLANALAVAEDSAAEIDDLVVAKVCVDQGLVLKRRKPSGRGRMRADYHRFSNVDLILMDRSVPQLSRDVPAKSRKARRKSVRDAGEGGAPPAEASGAKEGEEAPEALEHRPEAGEGSAGREPKEG